MIREPQRESDVVASPGFIEVRVSAAASLLLFILACGRSDADLDLTRAVLARPRQSVELAYQFVSTHRTIAAYLPCFCGCDSFRHTSLADCFVRERNARGEVTEWDYHGAACTICVDVALKADASLKAGKSLVETRTRLEEEYRPRTGLITPTPTPPNGGTDQ